MNVISGVVLVFILVCAGLECYSFISESIYETSTLNFGIFIRCSINNTCTIWNFDLFKNDLGRLFVIIFKFIFKSVFNCFSLVANMRNTINYNHMLAFTSHFGVNIKFLY